MNDLAMLDREPPRLADGPTDDPAAMLLRSARRDVAGSGAKDRARARLGIAESVAEESSSHVSSPGEIMRARRDRKKRSQFIEPFIPFQHLLVPVKPASTRKFGAVAVASLQVAAILAALFIRPFPRFDPPKESVASRQEEPELLFFESKPKPKADVLPAEHLAKNIAKPTPVRTNNTARPSLERKTSTWRESVVADEHAGLYSENSVLKAADDHSVSNNPLKVSLNKPPAPVPFGAGMSHPVRIGGVEPTYPTIARMRNVSGTVIMRCVVTTDGIARDCVIHKSPAYLDEAVLTASRTWRFTPAMDNGRPVSVFYVFKAKFQLR